MVLCRLSPFTSLSIPPILCRRAHAPPPQGPPPPLLPGLLPPLFSLSISLSFAGEHAHHDHKDHHHHHNHGEDGHKHDDCSACKHEGAL